MANRLADLNRQKRDYAYSGAATIGDTPWLYALQAEQAAANQPAGIGQPGGGMGEDTGAPNPQAFGGGGGSGGSSGGADIGMDGPGMTGMGGEVDQLYREWVERGGQAGEPGGVGDNYSENPYADPSGFGTVGTIGGQLTGIPGLGLIGAGIGAAYDNQLAHQFDPNYSGSFGSFLSSLGNIATGGLFGESQLNEAIGGYQDATGTGLSNAALAAGVTGGGYSGPKGVVGPQGMGGAGAGEGASQSGLNAAARSAYGGGAGSYSGPKGAPGPRGHDAGGWDTAYGGGGGGGQAGEGVGGGYGAAGTGYGGGFSGPPGGADIFHEGGYVSEDKVPGEQRGDVSATLQEGEGVLTADALEVLGPGFVYGVNMMAKMMRGR
jgi:hypothetical protein